MLANHHLFQEVFDLANCSDWNIFPSALEIGLKQHIANKDLIYISAHCLHLQEFDLYMSVGIDDTRFEEISSEKRASINFCSC